jgi:hypothetical protein
MIGAQARQAARQRQARQQHVLDEALLVGLEHRDLQVLARAEVREHAALGHLHAFGQGADGQALEADARRQLKRGRHDRGSREFAFLHDPV